MGIKNKIYCFPAMGIYSEVLTNFIKSFDASVIPPNKITKKTIQLGVKYSPEMICFPYKVVLGNLIENIEAGANTFIAIDTKGTCRFKHFFDIHQQVINKLGYKCDVLTFEQYKMFKSFKKINPKKSYFTVFRNVWRTYSDIVKLENREYPFEFRKNGINVGLVGEIYCMHEPGINNNIIKKLRGMDVNVDVSYKLSNFLDKAFKWRNRQKREEIKLSYKYLKQEIGGHARQTLYNSLYYARNNFDGIIHLLPLTCNPEITVQPLLDMISKEYNIPIYSFNIDENESEVAFKTRLETFVHLLKERKNAKFRN